MRKALWWPLGALAALLLVLAFACTPAATPTPSPMPSPTPTDTPALMPTPTATETFANRPRTTPPPGAIVVPVDRQVESEGITVGVKELWLTDTQTTVRFWYDCGPLAQALPRISSPGLAIDGGPTLLVFEGSGGMNGDPSSPLVLPSGNVLRGEGTGGRICDPSYVSEMRYSPLAGGTREVIFSLGTFLAPAERDLELPVMPMSEYLAKAEADFWHYTTMDLTVESDGLGYRFTSLKVGDNGFTLTYDPATEQARRYPLGFTLISGPDAPPPSIFIVDDMGNRFTGNPSGQSYSSQRTIKEGTLKFDGTVNMKATAWKLIASPLGKIYQGPWDSTIDVSAYTAGLPVPTPTAVATPTPTPTPSPTPTPRLTPAVPPVGDSARLLASMKKVPISWNTDSVWFQDWAEAYRLAGLTGRPTLEDFLARKNDVLQPYADATRGFVFGPELRENEKEFLKEWQEAFGFNLFQFDLALYAGKGAWWDGKWKPGYYEGAFDAATVRQKLLALGYQEKQAAGRTYYTIRDDLSTSIQAPFRYAFSHLNRVYVDDKTMVAAPMTAQMEETLATLGGSGATLADDKAFSAVAKALDSPLSAGMMSRLVAFDQTSSMPPTAKLEKRPGWGPLHTWDVLGIGYGRSADDSRWVTFAVYYPDRAAASVDAPEVRSRLENYETAITPEMVARGLSKYPFQEACTGPLVTAEEAGEGSVLKIQCQATSPSFAWWMVFVDLRDLGFLVP